MRIRCKLGVSFAGMLMSLSLAAAQPKEIPPGPVPTQILAAKKIFIANAGEDQPIEADSVFTGGSQRAYDEFYAAVKSTGKYELVGAPADADLLLELGVTVPPAGGGAPDAIVFGKVPYDPRFRLVIRDPKTNALLWTLIEHVQWAVLQGNRDKNFEMALLRIENDLQGLVAKSPVMTDTKP